MISDLKIVVEQAQVAVPVTIFHVSGWLDGQSEEQMLQAAREAHDAGARFLLVDMAGLDTMTSAGIRALQKVYQIFTPREDRFKVSHLKLSGAPPQIHSVLSITGFLHNIPMHATVADALQAFGND